MRVARDLWYERGRCDGNIITSMVPICSYEARNSISTKPVMREMSGRELRGSRGCIEKVC